MKMFIWWQSIVLIAVALFLANSVMLMYPLFGSTKWMCEFLGFFAVLSLTLKFACLTAPIVGLGLIIYGWRKGTQSDVRVGIGILVIGTAFIAPDPIFTQSPVYDLAMTRVVASANSVLPSDAPARDRPGCGDEFIDPPFGSPCILSRLKIAQNCTGSVYCEKVRSVVGTRVVNINILLPTVTSRSQLVYWQSGKYPPSATRYGDWALLSESWLYHAFK